MGEPANRRATYEDLFAVRENAIGEILDGALVVTPRPSPEHARATLALGIEIGPAYDFGRGGGPGGWIILYEPEVWFAGRGEPLVPDLAGWKRARFRRSKEHNWIDVIPDWICEVLSPGSVKRDRVLKMDIYRESAEVQHVWLVDPLNKALEVFGRDESAAWARLGFFADNDRVCAPPFEEVEFALTGLWLD